MTDLNKAYILDTDIGWDPDDILAVLILTKFCIKNKHRLAIISSNELPTNNRAMITKNIIDIILPDNNIIVAAGAVLNSTYISEKLLSHYNPNIKSIVDICTFIDNCKKDKYTVTWIGIGAMTNLCKIIVDYNYNIDHIIQMGGSFDKDAEFNILLDPISCKKILEKSSNYNSLEFIPLDTTGFKILWLNKYDKYDHIENRFIPLDHNYLDINFYSLLNKNYPKILNIIKENINCDSSHGYSGCSGLHDPLTVIYAITEGKLFKTYPAHINCNIYGDWYIKLNINTISAFNKKEDIKWWWSRINNYTFYNPINTLASSNYNCKVSIGPITNEEKNNFKNIVLDILQ
jgi:inosine-uridine nucleoside N-ribohydrolase